MTHRPRRRDTDHPGANPEGNYGWLEDVTGLWITEAIAEVLADPAGHPDATAPEGSPGTAPRRTWRPNHPGQCRDR